MLNHRPAAILLAALLLLGVAQPSMANDETVWSGLVLATKAEHPKEPPVEIVKFKTKLESIFGYNQFELIGQHTEVMNDPNEQWLIPSKDFCLRVMSMTKGKDGYSFKLRLFEQKKMLADFETKLEPQSPLFIRGPLYGGGQLIIILLAK